MVPRGISREGVICEVLRVCSCSPGGQGQGCERVGAVATEASGPCAPSVTEPLTSGCDGRVCEGIANARGA